MSNQTIMKECNIFEQQCADIENPEHEERPSIATNSEIVAHECILTNRCITADEILNE